MTNQTTLITGSTSGIGFHLAHEFAAHGHSLILVAPIQSELDEVAAGIRGEHGVAVEVIAADLEDPTAVESIARHITGLGLDVEILVNNAGHGFRGKAWELELEKDLSTVQLNVIAPLRLTKAFLPQMIARGKGRILNTASVAGFEPGPTMAVYHASKAFVLSWSESLAVETKDTGITVTALCPGPVDTDFFQKGGLEDAFAFQKGNLMAPQDVAAAGYKAVMNGDDIIVPGAINKVLVAGRRLLTEHAQAELNQKQYDPVEPDEMERERGDKESAKPVH